MIEKIKLNYDPSLIDGFISSETFHYHYDRHYQTYVDNVNKVIKNTKYEEFSITDIIMRSYDTFESDVIDEPLLNNALQVFNHQLYFEQFTDKPVEMNDKFLEIINKNFGSLEIFKKEFEKEANSLFGSGYVWLSINYVGKCIIHTSKDANNPIQAYWKPILCLDLWEHSYYIDYRNDRKRYIENFWNNIDWNVIYERYIYFCQ